MLQGGLFTRDWLTEGICSTPEWAALGDIAYQRSDIAGLVATMQGRQSPNEAETEKQLIYPVLALLGWDQIAVQQNMTVKGRSDVPDALLFLDAASNELAGRREPWQRFELGACLVEAKRWGAPLDRAAGKGEAQAPSSQLMHYLRRADDVTGGKMRWGTLTNGRIWRLYWQVALSVAEDFLEIDLAKAVGVAAPDLLDAGGPTADHLFRLFLLLFGRDAFASSEAGTTLHQRALAAGREWEAKVAADLSDMVFERVFPALVRALPVADPERPSAPDAAYLEAVRAGALILLYRLLFVLYAEDRNLLPDEHGPYKAYALTGLRHDIAEKRAAATAFSERFTSIWDRVSGIFAAIAHGDDALGIPPYNGGLFAESAAPILNRVRLPDSVMAEVLFDLSHSQGSGRPRYINYRDLSVQQLGSIYESILEYGVELKDGVICPMANQTARHRSGSFYTPESLVGLIIDKAVGPLVAERAEVFVDALAASAGRPKADRVAALHAADPATAITNLRIVDPAMGSGHFLVSLVDWLADRVLTAMADATALADAAGIAGYISPLADRIAAIRNAILSQARSRNWPIVEDQLDDRHIVRRIVLKRCVYGVDLNPMAVELAKVALWLHSFTVGAPLSFLDHHLRCGNSLLGAWVHPTNRLLANRGSLFIAGSIAKLDSIAGLMERIEGITDSDVAEVAQSKEMFGAVEDAVAPLAGIFDLVTAEAAAGIFDTAPARVRETGDALAARGGTAAQVTKAREAEARFARAAALQTVFEGGAGDQFAIARHGVPNSDDPRLQLAAAVVDDLRGFSREQRLLHWELAFPGVWQSLTSADRPGGFDAVIGNPPYVRHELLGPIKPALAKSYATFDGMADLYVYFYEQGLKLLRPGGRMGFVVTNKWLKAGYAEKLRGLFAEEAWVEFVADFGHAKHLFADADVFPCVVSIRRPDGGAAPETFDLAVIARDDVPRAGLAAAVEAARAPALRSTLTRDGWSMEPPAVAALLAKLRANGVPLVEAAGCRPLYGIKTGFNEAFLIDTKTRDRLVGADPAAADIIRPYLRGQDIDRWQPEWAGLWMILMKSSSDHRWAWADAPDAGEAERQFADAHPSLHAHFKADEAALRARQDVGRWWWELRSCAYYAAFAKPKIVYQVIQFHPSYAVDRSGMFSNDKTFILPTADETILATLNAPIMWWHNWSYLTHLKDEALSPMGYRMETLPIPRFTAEARDAITPRVESMLALTNNTRSADRTIADWLDTEIGLPKIPRALAQASLLDADGFVAAVRAALPKKQPLTAAGLKRLRDEHAATLAPAREQRLALMGHERALSDLVNAAYGLTPDDVALMWQTAPPRMPLAAP